MARLYKFCVLALLLLLIIEEGYCGKYKKGSEKNRNYKNKGKKGTSALEESENSYMKQSGKQFQHSRPTRSLKEKQAAEEQADEIIHYHPNKVKMLEEETEMQEPMEPTYKSNMVPCKKKSQCSMSQKPKKKAVYVVIDELEANTGKRGEKTKKILRRMEDSEILTVNGKRQKFNKHQKTYVIPETEETENIEPQEVEYKIRTAKKNKKEKAIPRYMVLENSEPNTFSEEESVYYGKKKSPRIIIESENQMEVENTTNEYYVYEEALVKPSSEPNETEEYDEYYPDIL